MGKFAKKAEEEVRRINEDVFGKVWKERKRAETNITQMFNTPSRGTTGDIARQEEAAQTEIRRIGPSPTEMTGGLSDQRNKDKEKRRRRLSMMTGGLGSANTSRLRLGA